MSGKRLATLIVIILAAAIALFVGVRYWRGGGNEKPYNILLITLDTTRADHLGCYGYSAALTPVLDGLAAEGVKFEHAESNVPMTLPSHATVMTGLLPPEHGIRINSELRLDVPATTVAEILRERGYQTGAFIAAVVLDAVNGLNRGFDTYSDKVPDEYKEHAFERLSAYRPGDMVVDDALAWLAKRDSAKPFFCWVHLFDPHIPYSVHEVLKGTRYAGQASYDGQIAFMDIQVGRLVDYLKKENLTAGTVVIAFGDHGEGLGEHQEAAHGYMLYDTTLHVPLIFSQPGRIPAGVKVGALVSLVDLFATMLDLANAGKFEERSGRSLAPAVFGQPINSIAAYSETFMTFSAFNWSPLWSLTTPDWKYIRSARLHLYDRPQDPRELNNLANERREKVEELEKELRSVEEEMVHHTAGQVELSPENIDRIVGLGYLSGGRTNFENQESNYSSLHDIDEMADVLLQMPRLRALTNNPEATEELITLLQDLIRRSPESPKFHSILIPALVKVGRLQEALAEGLEYLKLRPDDEEVCQTVASTYGYLGNNLEALKYYWKALRIKPDLTMPHEELAKMLRRYSDADGAARHDAEHRSSLGQAAEHYELGVVLNGEGKPDEAIAEFKKAMELAPDDPLVHFGLALALEQKGDYAGAAKECEQSLQADPDHPRRLYRLGIILGKAGRNQEAAEATRKLVQIEPQNVPARTNLGLVLARQGKLDEGLEQFAEALRLSPDDPQVHLTKAGVLEENGRMVDAVAEYREAVRLNPSRPEWAEHLARIMASDPDPRVRDGAEAVRLAEAACSATKYASAKFVDTLAAAYAEAGRFQEAVETASKALALAQAAGNAALAADTQQRLDLYRAGKPYRVQPN